MKVTRVRTICDICLQMDTLCDGVDTQDASRKTAQQGWRQDEEGDVCPSCVGSVPDYWTREPF